jgi:hypothetical protein
MNWIEIAAVTLLLIGIGAGGFLVAQRPSFWLGLGIAMLKAAWPYLSRRMSAEQEQEWRDCQRRGGEWDHHRKRCKR